MAPGREEEWTLSVQHTDADVDRYLDGLDAMAADLAQPGRGHGHAQVTQIWMECDHG
jgi:hypothetical protein